MKSKYRKADVERVFRAAMRWYRRWWPELHECAHGTMQERALAKACARAEARRQR